MCRYIHIYIYIHAYTYICVCMYTFSWKSLFLPEYLLSLTNLISWAKELDYESIVNCTKKIHIIACKSLCLVRKFTKHRTRSDGKYMHIYIRAVTDFKGNSAIWPWVESTSAERVNPSVKLYVFMTLYVKCKCIVQNYNI